MIVTRWQSAVISSKRCEMNMTAAPSSRSERATENSRSTSTPDSAAVGSSITRIRASAESALAISTICWSAIESPRAGRSGSTCTPSRVKRATACSRIAVRSMLCRTPSGCRPIEMFSATDRSGNSVGSW
jgi:hypothetical protein